MIKEIHTHENGSKCYALGEYGRTKLTKAGFYMLNGKAVAMAYNPYSWHWYAFDTADGREVASFDSDFFDKHIKANQIGELRPDPNCKA